MQIGSDSDWAAISLNNFGGVIGLKSDGTIWFWGASDCGQDGRGSGGGGIYTPTQIGTDSDWVAISLGDNIGALGLKSDGTIWFWGTNYYGQNGNGVADGLIYAPMQIGSDSDWATISLGPFAGAMGLKSDGTIWFWGGNFRGQDGSGVSSSVIYVPTQIGFGVDWVYISINDVGGVIGLKSDGTIWFWGTNSWGGNGSGAADLLVHAPMQIGSDSDWAAISLNNSVGALGLKSDGTIWFWGVNTYGQNGSGSGDFVVYAPMQIGVDFDWDSACINETAVIAIKP
jgi:alpha-tubulin suppressor-like RCC1 family protein